MYAFWYDYYGQNRCERFDSLKTAQFWYDRLKAEGHRMLSPRPQDKEQ
jgi:hypothetical protein